MPKSVTEDMRDQIKGLLTARPVPPERPNVSRRSSYSLWHKPFASEALGVNPDQIDEARANLRAHGITADFDEHGRCVLTSEKQFRDVARASGMYSGARGFEMSGEDGGRILTGREQVEGRRAFRRQVKKMFE